MLATAARDGLAAPRSTGSGLRCWKAADTRVHAAIGQLESGPVDAGWMNPTYAPRHSLANKPRVLVLVGFLVRDSPMQPPHVVGAFRMSAVSTISPFMIEPSRIARPLRLGARRAGRCDFRQCRGTYRVLDDRGLQSRDQSSPLMLGGGALACRRGVVRLGTVPPPSLVRHTKRGGGGRRCPSFCLLQAGCYRSTAREPRRSASGAEPTQPLGGGRWPRGTSIRATAAA